MKNTIKNLLDWNRTILSVKFLPILILILVPSLIDSTKDSSSEEQTTAAIDRIIEEEMIYGNLVGVAVAVVQNGRTIHQRTYGHKDVESRTPFRNTDLFRWASISKVLTAVAIHKLVEEGRIDLNDRVSDLVDYWPTRSNKNLITVEHLLSHRSGIRHYQLYNRNNYTGDADEAYDAEEGVDVFSSGSLAFTPGTDHRYSTFGTSLLGAVIDEQGGGFDSYINTNIKDKLGMRSLTYNSNRQMTGYNKFCDDMLTLTDGSDVIWKVPGGGFLSTIDDLRKFMVGLMNDDLLDNTEDLWTRTFTDNENYSLGLRRVQLGSELFVEHGGAHADMRTKMIFSTEADNGIAIAVNGGAYATRTRDNIIRRIFRATGISNRAFDAEPYHFSDIDNRNTNNPCNESNVAVWHLGDQNTILRRGYSTNSFGDEWRLLRDAGYVCVDFETYMHNDKRVWDGIFKKQRGGQAMWRNFDSDGFNQKWQEMSKQGYRLIDLETYMEGSKRLYAGLFLPGNGKYALYRGFSPDEFGKKREELGNDGFKLIDIEVYYLNGQQKWCGVWVEGKDGLLNRNYELSAFQKLVSARIKDGWNLMDVETYMDGRTRKWAGIWDKTNLRQEVNYRVQHDSLLSVDLNRKINDRMVLTDFQRY
ncbi:serine hydrolase [Algoriphagus hitonicola]|uniref:CubicO group peptidase, beta-lactamase class C family n=1 Tax=Algoriphagus hitonicola TaxID=435880 RepID=A0A1I2WPS8_9BACT|nr:serine hydrolase [Algoriphagus hitonicola]SFH02649.1 CubicO group peptidase, beta-lactamase class C family [Algoriphagus hitonicola]